ncbi:hypothetical protein [Candidatus Thiosymbion oneisti]|uniref:hypothetical protein n=1 Tax=Candidatus Thiosymbion oneisti TaxID=589554 RepID=UPI000B7C8CC1|nr:hypothetical protein [Candidatus Thiosymbion oneisti]
MEVAIEDRNLDAKDQKLNAKDQNLDAEDQKLGAEDQKLDTEDQNLDAEDQKLGTEDQNLNVQVRKLNVEDQNLDVKDQKLGAEDQRLSTEDQKLANLSRRRRDLDAPASLSNQVDHSQCLSVLRGIVRWSGQDGVPTLERGNERMMDTGLISPRRGASAFPRSAWEREIIAYHEYH